MRLNGEDTDLGPAFTMVKPAAATRPWRRWLEGMPANPLMLVASMIAGISFSLPVHGVVIIYLAAGAASICLVLLPAFSFGRFGNASSAAAVRLLPRLRLPLILTMFLSLGLLIGCLRLQTLGQSFLAGLAGKRITADITVTSPAKRKGSGITFEATADRVRYRGETGSAAADPGDAVLTQIDCHDGCPRSLETMEEGARLRIAAAVRPPASAPGADFDYAQYLRRRGINAILKAGADSVTLLPDRRGGLWGAVDRLRSYSRGSLRSGGWGAAGRLLDAMVLGDDQVVPEGVINDFQASGLLHMLAVSGENVVLLGFIATFLLRLLMVPRLPATATAIAAICLYVPLTGSAPSIMRAGVVGVMGLLATMLSRQANQYHFLALSALAIMALNPYSLLDPGFQLSFGAVLAIFFVSPVLVRLFSFLPGALREGTSITTAAGLVTAPIMLADFHQVSLVTVPANLMAAPVFAPVMMCGVLAVLTRPVVPLLSWIMLSCGALLTGYLIAISHFFASLPGSVYYGGSPGIVLTIAFYLTLAGAILLARRVRLEPAVRQLKKRGPVLIPLLIALLVLAVFFCFHGSGGNPPDVYTVSFLDVGQGDSELIQVPPSTGAAAGYTVLIDGGPGSAVAGLLRDRGVKRLDAVFLTHPHSDHVAGLIDVLNRFQVSTVFDAAPPSASTVYRDFLRLVQAKKISYTVARKGQSLNLGDLKLDVLSPGDNLATDDLNRDSIVLLASYRGLDILITGDAEGEVLATLNLPAVDILKVAHHGSRDPELNRVLKGIRPREAVISVGAGNPYGHPARETLNVLAAAGAHVYRTDLKGTITVSKTVDGYAVSAER